MNLTRNGKFARLVRGREHLTEASFGCMQKRQRAAALQDAIAFAGRPVVASRTGSSKNLAKFDRIKVNQATFWIYDTGFTIYERLVRAMAVADSHGLVRATFLRVTDPRSVPFVPAGSETGAPRAELVLGAPEEQQLASQRPTCRTRLRLSSARRGATDATKCGVAGESGVAAAALPPQSKIATGTQRYREKYKITKRTHFENARIA
ncbi:MAG: hypothetical protein JF609_07415 [Verrucomicrobia bacterium]|nr:hypothetical protein [Verrucomicrobiota bacterium]